MPTFTPALHAVVTRNCTQAMAAVLAAELGVSATALVRLGLGYLPAVLFKKGPNTDGHWAFPTRDANGRVVGLSLRHRLDGSRKPMFPGSKQGLFFVPQTASGRRWVRVDEAGVTCPVCEKPDWCLVDATNPQDPAAAVCPRTPADRQVGEAGYLHVLDPDRAGEIGLTNAESQSILAPSRLPVVVVEGASDTAALLGLGFVAVGRPSATGGNAELAKLTAGRHVVIFGENDRKQDGTHPGRQGAEKCEAALSVLCRSVRCVFPPIEYKDVRTWIVAAGLTQEALEEHITAHASPLPTVAKPPLLPNTDVDTIATAYLAHHCGPEDLRTLHYCQGNWFAYGPNGWRITATNDDVLHQVGRFMRRQRASAKPNRSGNDGVVGLNPTTSRMQSVLANLITELAVDAGLPSWLDGRSTPDPHRILCFSNGMLSVEAYLRGDDSLEAHTPSLFTASRLPFAYAADATCPLWDSWLEQTLGDDPQKIALLQEWFGYNLVPDNRFEKMLMMIGLPGSGKGTALSVMHGLLGDNAVASSMRHLSRDFGLSNLPGKLAVIFGDAILPRTNRESIMQVLLEIVGGDRLPVEAKYKAIETLRLCCRVTVATNNMPELPSENEAMRRRLMYLRFNRSFTDNPDTGLKDRLRGELPGITTWALHGLARLYKAGNFSIPAGQAEEERLFRNVTNPLGEFMERWVIRDATHRVTQSALYEAYRGYCESRGLKLRSAAWLFDRLQSLHQMLRRETVVERGVNVEYVTGINLQPWGRGLDDQARVRA